MRTKLPKTIRRQRGLGCPRLRFVRGIPRAPSAQASPPCSNSEGGAKPARWSAIPNRFTCACRRDDLRPSPESPWLNRASIPPEAGTKMMQGDTLVKTFRTSKEKGLKGDSQGLLLRRSHRRVRHRSHDRRRAAAGKPAHQLHPRPLRCERREPVALLLLLRGGPKHIRTRRGRRTFPWPAGATAGASFLPMSRMCRGSIA